MPVKIYYQPNTISLTYNIANEILSGDTEFIVRLIFLEVNPVIPDEDEIELTTDSVFLLTKTKIPNIPDVGSKVTIELNSTLDVGLYNYTIEGNSPYADNTISIPVNLKVINSTDDVDPVDIVYKIKYKIEQTDLNGNLIVCEIHKAGYNGVTIPIQGTIKHNYQEKNDHFEPITASNLQIELESSLDFNLTELYSEDEYEYKAVLKRNNRIIFSGFIKPDGIFEDYVYDKWVLSIDAYDGLSTLKNMAFTNKNGNRFTGNYSGIDIIYNCLIKTGQNLPILINCDVYYEGFLGYNSIFDYIFFNTERYFQNPEEPMDCESVLKSILQIFNCSIIQMSGNWVIYRSVDVSEIMIFYKYVDGIFSEVNSYFPNVVVGSQIEGAPRFHCEGNQKKSISPSVQVYRILYEYGGAKSILKNPELKIEGSGLDIPGWVVDNLDGRVVRNPNGSGVDSQTNWFEGEYPTLLRLAQDIDISQGAVFKLLIRYSNDNENSVGIRYSVAVGNQWLNEDGSWSTAGGSIFVNNSNGIYDPPYHRYTGKGEAVLEASIKAPTSGKLNIIIYRDVHRLGGGRFKVFSISLSGTNEGDIKGRVYTAQRTRKKSTVTKPNITVYNGDSQSDLFVGTIYKPDEIPTSKWYRTGKVESKELLEINTEDNLRIAPRPMGIFDGDVMGYLPFLSMLSFNNIQGKYLPMKYSYICSSNIVQLSSREYSSDFLDDSEFYVDIKNNYENETKVTIV
ncbi:hypothetical protein [Chryseobacterium indologenes]|uniref:Uncharacterized protein n=1 Tax=Chryseobacterium indologenes TaxID=253 RepID=A0A0N0ZST7_CHRID|nr:hypothetical protein [Chryseobacterium indologenes]KPE49770.1 hypothetical protein AOB46_18780 [Chryseobacterium indologenes]